MAGDTGLTDLPIRMEGLPRHSFCADYRLHQWMRRELLKSIDMIAFLP